MISSLESELKIHLPAAKEIFVASALISPKGFDFLKNNLPPSCFCNYVVGIDLPSSPYVLEELMEQNDSSKLNARIYNSSKTFHPKVYILRKQDNSLIAFVGSANTTNGGLSTNIEMTVSIEDSIQCNQLIEWFNSLFNQSSKITQEFLEKYKIAFKKIKRNQAIIRSDITGISNTLNNNTAQPLLNIQGQFFKSNHFEAYNPRYYKDYLKPANDRRKLVKNRLQQLHNLIYPQFPAWGLNALNKHYHAQNIVSSHTYRKNFNQPSLESIWLHYGYSKPEMKDASFIDHPRIQVILRWKYIGIWFVIGKDGGCYSERRKLKEDLENSVFFSELFYQEVLNLGGSYWINIGSKKLNVSEITSRKQLKYFIQTDEYSDYFIVGRDYKIDDLSLSEENIADTVLTEFQRLYPIYKLVHL